MVRFLVDFMGRWFFLLEIYESCDFEVICWLMKIINFVLFGFSNN